MTLHHHLPPGRRERRKRRRTPSPSPPESQAKKARKRLAVAVDSCRELRVDPSSISSFPSSLLSVVVVVLPPKSGKKRRRSKSQVLSMEKCRQIVWSCLLVMSASDSSFDVTKDLPNLHPHTHILPSLSTLTHTHSHTSPPQRCDKGPTQPSTCPKGRGSHWRGVQRR